MRDHAASSSSASPMRVLFTLGAVGASSDGELLSRFLDGRAEEAEAAFGVIVERHGPMVRQVCLSILGNPEDAADAFQASFIVLARRAGSIRGRDSVGPWLFGVARRVALKARAAAARRRRAERTKAEQDAPRLLVDDPANSPSADDWSALYKELDRLPARYRDPLVLCHLEGLTIEQAASRLGCPVGTLRTRLGRGRDRLRARLIRRGISPASVAPLLLAPGAIPSAPMALASIGWASSATRVAVASRGLSLASLSVPLASATLRSMSMIAFVRSLAIGGVALSALGLGAGGFLAAGNAGEGEEPSPVVPPPVVVSLPQDEPEPPVQDDGIPSPEEELPRPIEVFSEIPRQTRVLSRVVPYGTIVEEGDLVLELDASEFMDDLANQQIATERANADYWNALKSREIREHEVRQYREGTYILEEIEAEGAVKLARAEHELAKKRLLLLVERPMDPGNGPGLTPLQGLKLDIKAEEARVELVRAELALARVEKQFEVLKMYNYQTKISTLEGAVEMARADELTRKIMFELEKEKEERLHRMIEKCQVKAPVAGKVIYGFTGERRTIVQDQNLFTIMPPDYGIGGFPLGEAPDRFQAGEELDPFR